MWIVYFNNKPTYWLPCGVDVTIGRQDTDIVILDDSSVSRTHLVVSIALPTFERRRGGSAPGDDDSASHPALVTVADASKYGSSVKLLSTSPHSKTPSPQPAEHPLVKLKKDAPYTMPALTTQFSLCVGTHGVQFLFSWEPLSVFLAAVDVDVVTKLETRLARCGCVSAENAAACDIIVTSMLEPTQEMVVGLCHGKPIVSMSYFEAILARHSVKVPLPDAKLRQFLPNVDSFWFQLVGRCGEGEDDASFRARVSELLLPRAERRYLFADVTFVCLQPTLFAEVSAYLTACRSRVVLDDALAVVAPPDAIADARGKKQVEASNKAVLQAFCLRHQKHVVLYTCADKLPFEQRLVDVLENQCGIKTIEYTEVLRHIVAVRKFDQSQWSGKQHDKDLCEKSAVQLSRNQADCIDDNAILTRCTTEGGMPDATPPARKTNAMQLFADSSARKDTESQHKRNRDEDHEALWCSRELVDGADTLENRQGLFDDVLVPMLAPRELKLPPYPCFRSYRQQSAASVAGSKRFVKQAVTVSARFVDYEPAVHHAAEAALSSRIAPIDALDLFSHETSDVVPRENQFNKFETSERHRAERKRTTAKKGNPPAAVQKVSAVAARIPLRSEACDADSGAAPMDPHRHIDTVDIFAIDALF